MKTMGRHRLYHMHAFYDKIIIYLQDLKIDKQYFCISLKEKMTLAHSITLLDQCHSLLLLSIITLYCQSLVSFSCAILLC